MRGLLIVCAVVLTYEAEAAGRYLTWVDDQGRVHNTFVDEHYESHQRAASNTVARSDQARVNSEADSNWPGSKSSIESKRRYFTWVDASGNLQNSFYAGEQVQAGGNEIVLGTGERSSAYISSDVLEGRDYARDDKDGRYFTWVDEQGRMRNSTVPGKGSQRPTPTTHSTEFSNGRVVEFTSKAPALPSLNGQPTTALQELLAGTQAADEGPYQDLLARCCGQLADADFTPLSADEPRYEELNRFSPSLDFPMGKSYYVALKLPRSQFDFGLRIRSFANKQVAYPSLLFLDQSKQPTRLVSDAVYQLHGETWYRYAFLEGTVPVRAAAGEHYVLLLTTDDDLKLNTLDNKPFKRPLQALKLNDSGMQQHAHSKEGAFELAIVR
jgi:hypothetical protein